MLPVHIITQPLRYNVVSVVLLTIQWSFWKNPKDNTGMISINERLGLHVYVVSEKHFVQESDINPYQPFHINPQRHPNQRHRWTDFNLTRKSQDKGL